MTLEADIRRFFVTASDLTPDEAAPTIVRGNLVTPIIDGKRYFGTIRDILTGLGGPHASQQFFYTAGWWLHIAQGPGTITSGTVPAGAQQPTSPVTRETDTLGPFSLVGESGPSPVLGQVLADKAAAGVDIRVMGWVSDLILNASSNEAMASYWNVVVGTVLSLDWLRKATSGSGGSAVPRPLAQRAIGLTVGHLAGSVHLKMVVTSGAGGGGTGGTGGGGTGGGPRAFIGGLDFVPNRVDGELHEEHSWHDFTLQIEGPAVQTLYNLYRDIWNEQLRRTAERWMVGSNIVRSVEPGTTAIPDRDLGATVRGPHAVQVTRTLPRFRFSGLISMGMQPLSFAPSGLFEIPAALRKAIRTANSYVYLEDQAFFSRDIMDWLNERLRAVDRLKVILLTGEIDPTDVPDFTSLVEAINNHLLGQSDPARRLTPQQQARVGFFQRTDVVVHSKLTIVDDRWLHAGTANCERRSLYTDIEASAAVLGPALDRRGAPVTDYESLAEKVRVDLWGGHFGLAPDSWARGRLRDIDRALGTWDRTWSSSEHPAPLPPWVTRRTLPLPPPTSPDSPAMYDLKDPDSRQELSIMGVLRGFLPTW